jgi:hypothetical protein
VHAWPPPTKDIVENQVGEKQRVQRPEVDPTQSEAKEEE